MTNPIGPDLFRHLQTAADPTLTPDGRQCAYVLAWVDADTQQNRSRIYRVNADGNGSDAPQPFTRGNSDTHPRYSPDGAMLALLRPQDPASAATTESPRQIWLMPADGGEAGPLTQLPLGVREFAWSPDSRRIALVADVAPAADVDGDGDNDTAVLAPPDDAPVVKEMRRLRYRHDAIGWRGDNHFHIFIADVGTGAVHQITAGDWDDTAPAWSPDGRRIAFISGRAPDRDVTAANQVYVIDAPDALPSDALPPAVPLPDAELWSAGLADVAAVVWSPDGSQLLAAGAADDGLSVLWQSYLYILAPGRPPRRLTDDRIRPCLGYPGIYPPLELRWTAGDGDSDGNNNAAGRIILLADAAGATRLYTLPVPAPDAAASSNAVPNDAVPDPQPLTAGGELLAGIAYDAAAQRIAIVSSDPAIPSDLHLYDAADGARRRLTAHNDHWLAQHPPSVPEKFRINRSGWDLECRLYHPQGFDAAQQYPLLLEIHGGPNGAFYDAFVPWHQVPAGAGYLVLAVNPRGSSTYGAEFVNAVLGDWGGEDYRDLMAAVDAVGQRPYVDADRLLVHGYSYGGYMTAWTIGQTDRFRAAVAGAPCIDLWSMYGTSDIAASFGETQWAQRPAGGAPPSIPMADELAAGVDNLAYRLLQRSPITYAPQVNTPTLLLHGETDARCPISQSEQYFQILTRLGKTVEMARFPNCGHGFLRTGHVALRQAYLERMLAWFGRWV